jgi:hypothetical protein
VFEDVQFTPKKRGVRIGIPYTTKTEEIRKTVDIINKEIKRINKQENISSSKYRQLYINFEDCSHNPCSNHGISYKFGRSDGRSCEKCACRQIPTAQNNELKIFYDSNDKCNWEEIVTIDNSRTDVSGGSSDNHSYYSLDQVKNGYIAAIYFNSN